MVTSLALYIKHRDFKRRMLCLLLCLLVTFMIIGTSCQEVRAVVEAPALMLMGGAGAAGTALSIACGVGLLLIAAGLTYLVVTELNEAIDDYYNSSTPEQKQQIADAVNTTDGTISINDQVWNNVRQYVNAKYDPAQTSTGTIAYKIWTSPWGEQIPYTNGNSMGATTPLKIQTYSINGHVLSFILTSSTATADYYRVLLDGITITTTTTAEIFNNNSRSYQISYNQLRSEWDCKKGTKPWFESYVDSSGKLYMSWARINSSNSKSGIQVYTNSLGTDIAQNAPQAQTSATINYGTTSELTNSTWDVRTQAGTTNFVLPQSTDSLVNKKATDVAKMTTTSTQNPPASTTTYPGSWTGAFKDCATGMGEYTFTGSGTIVGEMDYSRTGTWEGDWTWTSDGARVWTGTYTAANSQTWTGTATATLAATWPYQEWKAPSLVITKFPFCIPWDLKNALTSITVPPVAPKWTLDFPQNAFVGGGQVVIDFKQFESWAQIIRWGVLILFNIGLISITRRLIKG